MALALLLGDVGGGAALVVDAVAVIQVWQTKDQLITLVKGIDF